MNTTGVKETVELLDEYAPRYEDFFPKARVRFKQLSYSDAVYPVEVRLSGEDLETLKGDAQRVEKLLQEMPGLTLVQTDFNEPLPAVDVRLREDVATRLGVTNLGLESTLAMRYGEGLAVANVWEGDYRIPVKLKGTKADQALPSELGDEMVPATAGLADVPLRQVAEVKPTWKEGQIVRRNGVYTASVTAELERGENAMRMNVRVQELMKNVTLSPGVSASYGGEQEANDDKMPMIMQGLALAAAIIFFILLAHFRKVSIALLMFASLLLCLFGTATGVLIQGVDFGVTCVLGIIALMGIIVRNGIIMFDYAEELRTTEHMTAEQAIYHSAQRRMRPIFLTSAAASMNRYTYRYSEAQDCGCRWVRSSATAHSSRWCSCSQSCPAPTCSSSAAPRADGQNGTHWNKNNTPLKLILTAGGTARGKRTTPAGHPPPSNKTFSL